MSTFRLSGLIAATYSPLDAEGNVNLSVVPPMLEHLLADGVTGLYVCGSTGEGMSLTTEERMRITDAWIAAADGRVPVIVQVGHNSLRVAAELARHAQQAGADVVSATCPSYFKVTTVATLVECMAEIANAAPDLPFYYYHIPGLTGSTLDIVTFLEQGGHSISNLAGLKYTATTVFEFQECLELQNRRFDVVWGCDEMLLAALATGAGAAIGSTYNVAAPLYRRLIRAFEAGDLTQARRLQLLSVQMVRTIGRYPFHPAMKEILRAAGLDTGRCRLPQPGLTQEDRQQLMARLKSIGFFEWSR